MRRLSHFPATVSGDGPTASPSTVIIEPAGVVEIAILHGPLPTTPPPVSSPGGGSVSVLGVVSTTGGSTGFTSGVARCMRFDADATSVGDGVAAVAVLVDECEAATSAIATITVAPAAIPITQRRRFASM